MLTRNKLYFYYLKDEDTEKSKEKLSIHAEENGFIIVDNMEKANIIASIGGDGTFLQAVRKSNFRQDCLYIGITREGESGLYCDFNIDNIEMMLHALLYEELEIRRFPVIQVQINDGNRHYCLNEISVRSTIVKTIIIDVQIDGNHFETFRGDGLIVSTPTGSTGYSKSANGAVIDPLLRGYQISEVASLNNNQYRTLGSSFILDKTRKLSLDIQQMGNDHPIISLDNEAFPIRRIFNVNVEMGNNVIKTVKLKSNSYWDRVKRTFL